MTYQTMLQSYLSEPSASRQFINLTVRWLKNGELPWRRLKSPWSNARMSPDILICPEQRVVHGVTSRQRQESISFFLSLQLRGPLAKEPYRLMTFGPSFNA